MLLEVCVDSVESIHQAISGGAGRIELCSALSEGGLTPTCGFLTVAKKICKAIPVYAMLRPRRGNDFIYSELEMENIVIDLKHLKDYGADGFVFGALNINSAIDIENCKQIVLAASPLPVTFHRAFDLTSPLKMFDNLDVIRNLGFHRILSSGFMKSAELGINNLKKMIKYVENFDLIVMPGAGINSKNLLNIIQETGCIEFHASARKKIECKLENIAMGGDDDNVPVLVTDKVIVEELINISKMNL